MAGDPIRVVPLRPGDYDRIVEVWRSAGLHFRPRGRDSRRNLEDQLRRNKGLYLGASKGDRLVGVVLATDDTRKGWINRLAVMPEYRRHGVGSRLVRAAERALAGRGIDIIAAHVDLDNPRSLRFFRELGYATYPVHYVRKKRKGSA